jgi:hypothetical protein
MTLHISLPDKPTFSLPDKPTFDVGLESTRLVITTDPELEAVVIAMPQMDLELVLSMTSTIDMILKVIGVLDRLQEGDES